MKIDRMNKGSWGKVRAFFDLQTTEGFTLKGFKLIEGINGLFVGFPSQKGSDDEYRDTIWADKELKDKLTDLSIQSYNSDDIDQSIVVNEGSVDTDTFDDDDIPF